MPDYIDVRSPLIHACGARLYRILPEGESNQITVNGTGQTLTEVLMNIDRALGGNTSMRFCPNIASRNELAGIMPGDRVYVMDASGDDSIEQPEEGEPRGAFYIFLPTMQWRLIGEFATQDMKDYVGEGSGLMVDEENHISLDLGPGLTLDDDGKIVIDPGAGLTEGSGGKLQVDAGDGLAITDGALINRAPMWNTQEVVTVSGTWTAKVTGWHEITLYHGGMGGVVTPASRMCYAGWSYLPLKGIAWFAKGQAVEVAIGAGGPGHIEGKDNNNPYGGLSHFGPVSGAADPAIPYLAVPGLYNIAVSSGSITATSSRPVTGGAYGEDGSGHATLYGGGGAAKYTTSSQIAGNGKGGCAIVRYYDPAKNPAAQS